MLRSPTFVVLILPSVILPCAVKLTKPEPALISVSPLISKMPLPAVKLILPLALVKSASPVICMPCVARMSIFPVTVVIGVFKVSKPEVVCKETVLFVLAVTAALTVR